MVHLTGGPLLMKHTVRVPNYARKHNDFNHFLLLFCENTKPSDIVQWDDHKIFVVTTLLHNAMHIVHVYIFSRPNHTQNTCM